MDIKKSTVEMISNKWEEIEKLRKEGIDPFGHNFIRTGEIEDLIEKNKNLDIGECSQEEVVIAGRLMALRRHGKAIFGNIEDISGKIQIYIKFGLNELMTMISVINCVMVMLIHL